MAQIFSSRCQSCDKVIKSNQHILMDGVKVKSVKINLKNNCKSAGKYLLTFLKWFALAAVTGAVGGAVGALFHLSVEYVTGVRKAHSWIVFLLPIGGLVIAGLYKLSAKGYRYERNTRCRALAAGRAGFARTADICLNCYNAPLRRLRRTRGRGSSARRQHRGTDRQNIPPR